MTSDRRRKYFHKEIPSVSEELANSGINFIGTRPGKGALEGPSTGLVGKRRLGIDVLEEIFAKAPEDGKKKNHV